MNSHELTHFTDPGTLAGLWSGLSLAGAITTLLLTGSALFC